MDYIYLDKRSIDRSLIDLEARHRRLRHQLSHSVQARAQAYSLLCEIYKAELVKARENHSAVKPRSKLAGALGTIQQALQPKASQTAKALKLTVGAAKTGKTLH